MKLPVSVAIVTACLMLPLAIAATSDAADTNSILPTTTTTPLNDPVIAKGKGFEIRRSRMDQVLATAKANNPQEELPSDAEIHVINQLIEMQVVLQKATDAEKAEGKKQAEEKLAGIMKSMSATEFERRLKATRMTADDLRVMLFQEDAAQVSLTRQLGIKVTDVDAKKFFDEHPGAYDQPEVARVRELLLLTTSDFSTSSAPPLPTATIEAKRRQIQDLYKRVRAGEDFAALARQYNEDPLSKESGGELPFTKNQVEFGDLAFSMKTNQISEVLTNVEGFRFFQLLQINPARKAEFPDLSDRIKNMLVGKQKRQLAPAYIRQLRKEADIEILDAGLKAKIAVAEAASTPPAKP